MRNIILLTVSYLLLSTVLLSACSDQMDPVSVNEKKGSIDSSELRANLEAHSNSNVYWFEDASEVDGATATLLRTDTNVRMKIKTTDLDPHHTYTVWW